MNIGYFLAFISLIAAAIGVAEDEEIIFPACGVILFSIVGYLESKL